ncbi:hypothetical protein RJ640_007663 [Escallonia rubra]|uniref:RNase H type-1 domain-containing protein n=1 Tax=Escallonia rubra TaxID=112253 RepID=A0AA88U9I8_9ASTE|nr:hypothetical protein RJ640_007663 [Escallonia rubra]
MADVYQPWVAPTWTPSRTPSLPCYGGVNHRQMRVEQLPPRKVTLVQWHPPSPGFLKLNTDRSAFGQPGPASYGGLIRGEKGEWICGYAGNIGIRTSLTAEICGIYKGLCLIREKNLCRVMIETDCMAAISLISSREEVDDKHPMKRIIDECREIMASCGCFMVHTVREGNFCADMLAKLGHWLQSDYIELRDPPLEVTPYLSRDAVGFKYKRPLRHCAPKYVTYMCRRLAK